MAQTEQAGLWLRILSISPEPKPEGGPVQFVVTLHGVDCQTSPYTAGQSQGWGKDLFFASKPASLEPLSFRLFQGDNVIGKAVVPFSDALSEAATVVSLQPVHGSVPVMKVTVQAFFSPPSVQPDVNEGSLDCAPLGSPVSLEKEIEALMDLFLQSLNTWTQRSPTEADVKETRAAALKIQGTVLTELKRMTESHLKLQEEEKELKARVANLWKNNASLEKELHYLRGELDLMQRKCRTLEKNIDKQSDKFQLERDGLVQGRIGQKTAMQQLQYDLQVATAQLEVQQQREREAAIKECLATERANRMTLIVDCQDYILDTAADMISAAPTTHFRYATGRVAEISKAFNKPSSVVLDMNPGSFRRSSTGPATPTGPAPEIPRCAITVRQEQAQRLSETLTALRLRIEGALEACATDTAVFPRAASSAADALTAG